LFFLLFFRFFFSVCPSLSSHGGITVDEVWPEVETIKPYDE